MAHSSGFSPDPDKNQEEPQIWLLILGFVSVATISSIVELLIQIGIAVPHAVSIIAGAAIGFGLGRLFVPKSKRNN